MQLLLPKTLLLITAFLIATPWQTKGQDTVPKGDSSFPFKKTFTALSKKAFNAERDLDKTTESYLSKLQKQEEKLRRKVWKKDTAIAHQLFDGLEEKYAVLQRGGQKLSKYTSVYSGHLDSLTASLNFLKTAGLKGTELQNALSGFTSLQTKLDRVEAVKKFLNERKRLLKENLERLGMLKDIKGFSKEAYYYSAQLKEYKQLLEDPSKLEKKLFELVIKSDKFKEFFRQNSQFTSLFASPGGNTSIASLQSLQTRANVQQAIATRFGTGPNVQQTFQQNVQAAQGQLAELKAKFMEYGSGDFSNSNGEIDMPEGFQPNSRKTKTLLQRLEYGVNVQSQKAQDFFPMTSDLGLSIGYKLNDKSSFGIGVSYKLGWGRGWNNIRFTNEGVGMRSYVDYNLKGNLYLSGGYEQNYRTAFGSIPQLKDCSAWQTSGLVGLSKRYKVSNKVQGDVKLLWDFLSHQQVPRTQAILFRIGYSLK